MSNTALKSHFAKMCGVSQMAIGKACKSGSVKTCMVSGKEVVNLSHRITKAYLSNKEAERLAKTGSTKPPKVEKKVKAEKKPKAAPKVKKEKEPEERKPDPFGRVRSLEDITPDNIIDVDKQDIDKFKVYEQALETKLKREERRGDLIPRLMVRQAFSKLYQIYVNQFKTAEDRLVPDICAIFAHPDSSPEAVKLRALLSADTAKGLTHTHRTFNDFLRKVKADKI